jgi:hypothetical protein
LLFACVISAINILYLLSMRPQTLFLWGDLCMGSTHNVVCSCLFCTLYVLLNVIMLHVQIYKCFKQTSVVLLNVIMLLSVLLTLCFLCISFAYVLFDIFEHSLPGIIFIAKSMCAITCDVLFMRVVQVKYTNA